jgi:hypothetical protein
MELGLLMALLVVAGGLAARRKLRATWRKSVLSDDMVQRIEKKGRLRVDVPEPLDLDEIREEEDEFWAQTWDLPEEL